MEPKPLDSLGRWIFVGVLVTLAAVMYLKGGFRLVMMVAASILVIGSIGSLIWTVAQSIRNGFGRPEADKDAGGVPAFPPFHRRFVWNLRRLFIDVPLYFLAYP